MLALGAPAVSLAEGLQNQPQAPKVKPGQEPQPEAQTAQKYPQQLGAFINRPLTQVSKAADALLDDLEGRACDFFYNEASPKTGLVRDRASAVGRSLSRVASIAATGFGLSALCIAAKRNYLRPGECEARVEKTLAFLLEECPHEHGFLYHFIDIESGQRMFGSELSSIDTALLLCGVLLARQYFAGNTRIEALATTFYRRIDWEWMLNGGTDAFHGMAPGPGISEPPVGHLFRTDDDVPNGDRVADAPDLPPTPGMRCNGRWCSSAGSTTSAESHRCSFINMHMHGATYRDIRDLHANYFTNSIAATRSHQLWCLTLGQNFPGSIRICGVSRRRIRRIGYRVWGGPPAMGPLDGTLVPCAAAGSLPFLPAECSHVLLTHA